MDNAEKAINFILKHEGGYVSNPTDPGGETNFGISKKQFPELDIRNLSRDDAVGIYRLAYWTANRLNAYPWPYSAACLDAYVQHSGKVVDAMIASTKPDVRALLEARRVYYLGLIAKKPSLIIFKNGWMNRLNDLSKFCDIESQAMEVTPNVNVD